METAGAGKNPETCGLIFCSVLLLSLCIRVTLSASLNRDDEKKEVDLKEEEPFHKCGRTTREDTPVFERADSRSRIVSTLPGNYFVFLSRKTTATAQGETWYKTDEGGWTPAIGVTLIPDGECSDPPTIPSLNNIRDNAMNLLLSLFIPHSSSSSLPSTGI